MSDQELELKKLEKDFSGQNLKRKRFKEEDLTGAVFSGAAGGA